MRKILEIAHRGASLLAPENTKTAFLAAMKAQADGIELDVHLTKDQKIVVIHDDKIDRTSNGTGKVSRMSYAELKKYNFGTSNKKEKILTLEETLKIIKNKCLVIIEIKNTFKGKEQLLLNLVSKGKKILLCSTYKSIIRRIRKKDKTIKLGLIINFSLLDYFLLPYYRYFSKKYNLSFFSVGERFDKPLVKKFIQKLPLTVYLWTINDFTSRYQVSFWKIDGIITNSPGILKNHFRIP